MSDPMSEIAAFLRNRFGRPSPDVERVIEAFQALLSSAAAAAPAVAAGSEAVPSDVVARLDAIEARLAKLEAASAAPSPSADQPDVIGASMRSSGR